ncbi:MAG: hypothetical protein AAB554_01700 [Patescibacteria group bacterium]
MSTIRSFEFRRHSIKDGPGNRTLGPRGFALARAVGKRQLRGRGFTDCFATNFWRTVQTLVAFDEGAGGVGGITWMPDVPPIYAGHDRPDVRAMFRECRAAEIDGRKMLDTALALHPDLCHEIGIAMKSAFLDWNDALPDDANVLIVGHSPSLEFLARAFSIPIGSLRECQGFRLHVEDMGPRHWSATSDHISSDLDPSAIRAELKLDEEAWT